MGAPVKKQKVEVEKSGLEGYDLSMDPESALEWNRYFKVSGLAAIQAKEREKAKAPVPDKESMAADL